LLELWQDCYQIDPNLFPLDLAGWRELHDVKQAKFERSSFAF